MLDTRSAFKVGFLACCAEAGLSREEISHVVKTAQDKLASLLGGIGSVLQPVAHAATGIGAPLALLAPPVLGGAAGYALSRATDIDDTDVKEVQDHELLDAYKTETQKLRRQKHVRDFRKNQAKQYRPYYG